MLNNQSMGEYGQAPYLMQNFAFSGGQIGVDVGAGGSVWSTGAPSGPSVHQQQHQQYSPQEYYGGNHYSYGSYMAPSPHQYGAAGVVWNQAAAAAAAAAANSYESGDLSAWPSRPDAYAGYAAPLLQHPTAAVATGAIQNAAVANQPAGQNGSDSVTVLEQGISAMSVQQQSEASASSADYPTLGTSTTTGGGPKTWAKIAASQAPTVAGASPTSKPASVASAPGEPTASSAAAVVGGATKAGANQKALGKGTGGLAVRQAASKQQQQQGPARIQGQASLAPGQGYEPQQYQQQQHQNAGNRGQLQSSDQQGSSGPLVSEEHLRQLEKDINPPKLEVPEGSEFYVIKSYSEDDIHRAIKYSIWCSTRRGNETLNEAFRRTAAMRAGVYLLFSVNGSGHFCGVAQMTSEVDANKNARVWCQDKWLGEFGIKWLYVKDVPNSQLRHVRVATNENKPVTNSRDCTNVPLDQGRLVLNIIRAYKHSTSIFDDFNHYERREQEGTLQH